MREVTIGEKMRAGTGRTIRAMIRSSLRNYEKKVPRALARAQHIDLMLMAADFQDAALQAARDKAERLTQHAKRQKSRRAKRKANYLRKQAQEHVAAMEQRAKRMRDIAGS